MKQTQRGGCGPFRKNNSHRTVRGESHCALEKPKSRTKVGVGG